MSWWGPARLWTVAVLLLILSACGSGSDIGSTLTGAGPVAQQKVKLPSQILGLAVVEEPISKEVKTNKRPYIKGVALFSLRENDLVRATLQINEFNDLARPNEQEFRSSIIDQVGATRPTRLRVGKDIAYSTVGTEQSVFVWFFKRRMFVLTTHRDYEFRRTLLRHSIELGKRV